MLLIRSTIISIISALIFITRYYIKSFKTKKAY